MAKYSYINLLFIHALLMMLVSPVAASIGPMEVIRSSNDKILTIYRVTPKIGEKDLSEIFSVMESVTDFDAMADSAVEEICEQSSVTLCDNLKSEFIKLLKLNATRKLGRYRADRFDYHGEDIAATGQAIVKTIAHFKEDSVPLDYVLERKGEKWIVVNYIANDVDTIQNYQKQFGRIAKKKSLEFLINRIKKKNDQYQKEREDRVVVQ